MSPGLVSLLLFGVGPADAVEALARCVTIEVPEKRLACYDGLAKRAVEHVFTGTGAGRRDVFTLSGPRDLYFECEDVIMLVDVMRPNGEIVQNLHLGGQGVGHYRIESGGAYRVEINASGRWRVWIAAPSTPPR